MLCGALLAIVATIYHFQGRPLPDWPYGLSINTLISIYVVMMKAAIAFVIAQGIGQLKWSWFSTTRPMSDIAKYDNASRGSSLGSLDLMVALRGR